VLNARCFVCQSQRLASRHFEAATHCWLVLGAVTGGRPAISRWQVFHRLRQSVAQSARWYNAITMIPRSRFYYGGMT
jgi:hypothetical protein